MDDDTILKSVHNQAWYIILQLKLFMKKTHLYNLLCREEDDIGGCLEHQFCGWSRRRTRWELWWTRRSSRLKQRQRKDHTPMTLVSFIVWLARSNRGRCHQRQHESFVEVRQTIHNSAGIRGGDHGMRRYCSRSFGMDPFDDMMMLLIEESKGCPDTLIQSLSKSNTNTCQHFFTELIKASQI